MGGGVSPYSAIKKLAYFATCNEIFLVKEGGGYLPNLRTLFEEKFISYINAGGSGYLLNGRIPLKCFLTASLRSSTYDRHNEVHQIT